MGVAKKSNEHIVVREGGGPAIRCRSVKRRPVASRWSAEKVAEIEASQRRPCPETSKRGSVEAAGEFKIARKLLERSTVTTQIAWAVMQH